MSEQPQLIPGSSFFRVDEIPQYEPQGSGEHLYVHIRKENCTSDVAAKALAKACGVSAKAVGMAGRKDRHAITTQWMSIHFGDEDGLENLSDFLPDGATMETLQCARHSNKLKLGHLRGNRFALGISGITNSTRTQIDTLNTDGLINTFGSQRFGHANIRIASALAANNSLDAVRWTLDAQNGDWEPGSRLPASAQRSAPAGMVAHLRKKPDDYHTALKRADKRWKFMISSAAQALFFNAVATGRQAAGLLHELRVGDIANTPRGASFEVSAEDLADCQARVHPERGELFTSGPMPGKKCLRGADTIHQQEITWAQEHGAAAFPWDCFIDHPILGCTGERRPLRVPLIEPATIKDNDTVSDITDELSTQYPNISWLTSASQPAPSPAKRSHNAASPCQIIAPPPKPPWTEPIRFMVVKIAETPEMQGIFKISRRDWRLGAGWRRERFLEAAISLQCYQVARDSAHTPPGRFQPRVNLRYRSFRDPLQPG